jgi:hypothetical protein
MKRTAIALLLQPYKNRLMPRDRLKESIDGCAEQLLALAAEFPTMHCNVVLPGYVLECINPLLLSKLRDLRKHGCLEWLLTGYTEPFLSFSPEELTKENIRHGVRVFTECTGAAPAGFMPPFSNWEPSYIAALRSAGLSVVALSANALPREARGRCGYWIAEHAGAAIALFPSHVLHHYSAPADIIDWLEKIIARDEDHAAGEKLVVLHYLLPLQPETGIDPYRWLRHAVAELDKRILIYQTVLFQEATSLLPPSGLQHVPACLAAGPGGGPLSEPPEETPSPYFLNRLHGFDQVGIIQRKMMDVWDKTAAVKNNRLAEDLRRRLYFVQDINRYLPRKNGAAAAGFSALSDRLWSYGQLIDLERALREHEGADGGRIMIGDFLRNGNKSIVMENNGLKAYVDYKNGGRIFELDYGDRSINLCAAFNPEPHAPPDILSPQRSLASFTDRIHPPETTVADFTGGSVGDLGNFAAGAFEYKIKKTDGSIKTVLSRQGSFLHGDKAFPLSMEKVFGLDKNDATLSFVYQLANLSLACVRFTFAAEIYLSLPGVADHNARCINGKNLHTDIGGEPVVLEKTAKWSISDFTAGVRLQFVTQKPLDVVCLPVRTGENRGDPACGIKIVLASPVALDQSSSWTLMGSIACKKVRKTGKVSDDTL